MTVIKVKNSNVAGRLPAAGDLVPAELALNLQDKKLYSKDTAGEVFEIGVAGDVPSGINPPAQGNNAGDLWFKTDTSELLYWSGTAWEVVTSEPATGSYVKDAGDNMTGNLTLGPDGDVKIKLDAGDGEAIFDGTVEVKGGGTVTLDKNGVVNASAQVVGNSALIESVGGVFYGRSADLAYPCVNTRQYDNSGYVWTGRRSNNNITSYITATGAAEFDGAVTINDNLLLDAGGERKVAISNSGAASFAINGSKSGITLNADGSADFAGDVTANNVTFNLDPDNEANYTSTIETYTDTEEYEGPLGHTLTRQVEKTREVKKYSGPTLDVKQTLLDITGALESLKTAAASATTIAELRDAIETALANI